MLANFHMCGIMWVLRAVFNMLMRNASPREPMCKIEYMMFNLSGPCEFFFTSFYCLLDLSCGECYVISFYFVRCVFDSVCELFGETIRNVFGCGCYFVVECYGCVWCVWWCSVGETMYGLPKSCACDPNERLSAPSICFVCVFVCRKLSPHLGV